MGRFNPESPESPESPGKTRLEMQGALKEALEAFRVFIGAPELALNPASGSRKFFDPRKLLAPPAPDSPLSVQMQWAERQSAILDHPAKDLPSYYSAEFQEAAATLSAVASAWEAWIGAILSKVLGRFETLKSALGMATFGDIVRSALDGLLKDKTIAPPRPKLLLVDEYQDTSRSQDAFLGALGAARTVRVGDAKQAIYGFRGSSPELFQEHIDAAGDRAYRLGANYRSAPPIVDVANTFVKDLWPAKDASFAHAGAEQEPQAKGSCPVGAAFVASESRGTDLPALSRWIAALSNESGWDGALGKCPETKVRPDSRPTRALLLRQRTKLPALLLRLKRHGVQPYVLAVSGFWDSPGIRLLMAALEAFAHPNRPLPCAILLRHFAGLSDLELHRMRRDKETGGIKGIRGIGSLDIESAPIEKRPKVAWLKALQTTSAQGIAASLLAHGDLLPIIASLDAHGVMEPPRARRNLAGFLSMLQALPASPATAFALLNELRDGPVRGDLPAASQDADLLIQTVHASKGLEYDDVILPLLHTRKTSIRKGRLLTNPDTGTPMLAWRFGEEPGKNHEMISGLVESQQRRDELNLFYVAMTRAKKRLCLLIQTQKSAKVNGKGAKGKSKENESEKSHNSWAQLGKELFVRHPGMLELADPPSMPAHGRQGAQAQEAHEKPRQEAPGKPPPPTPPPGEAPPQAAPPPRAPPPTTKTCAPGRRAKKCTHTCRTCWCAGKTRRPSPACWTARRQYQTQKKTPCAFWTNSNQGAGAASTGGPRWAYRAPPQAGRKAGPTWWCGTGTART
jgi:ATP-dependent exoDNAse (exonuclease V) beta subunit